ncbi:MAG TPA: UDP-N-acetylmuramate--L-alanine ligase [Candidatus Kapabacteria bacterium]|nr:UDP-N-acetylmuramate--L-alanine ligase [Candidatus Kapabacteria bacterium]
MEHVHFIGIGGAGTSGLAEILLLRGIAVSGSDAARSKKTEELEALGAKIWIGHDAHNIDGADVVVYSSAVRPDNVERMKAAHRGISLMRRAEFMGELLRDRALVAIAGTHGKTTVTSMIASILIEAKLDPLVLAGASVRELGNKNSRAGTGKIAVAEADEYDRSFLALHPYIAVLTSLEAEHMDIYGDIESLKDAFVQFANQGPSTFLTGYAIVCIDEPLLREITTRLHKRIVSYGLHSPETKFRAIGLQMTTTRTRATLLRAGEAVGEIELRVPGEHNVKNALAAIATADVLSIPLEISLRALKHFRGAERRFEVIGEAGGILVVDDYAHHPTELRATLSTARNIYRGRRIVACFQPHTFTRTRDFAEDFGNVLATNSDVLVLLDIYPAREVPIEGVTSALISNAAKAGGMQEIYHVSSPETLVRKLGNIVQPGDVVLTLGAGTITEAAPEILKLASTSQTQVTAESEITSA